MTPLLDPQTLRTVLIVDSDAENRTYLREEFEARGFIILEAEDGPEALERLSHTAVGAVVLDLELSRLQRATLVKQILASRGTPLVFLLVSSAMLSREEAYDLGASGVMSKPVNPNYLVSRIGTLLTPANLRWKAGSPAAANPRHRLSASVFKKNLGRGGFALSGMTGKSLLEGESVEFQVEVKSDSDRPEPWVLSGTGIVRYVSYDPQNRLPSGWGIEFESLDEISRETLLQRLSSMERAVYIPRLVS